MAGRSALINVMHKASMAASKRLMRDFGEVENLQVTRKGSADFVSQADISAERTIQAELAKARPDWGFIMEEAGQIDAEDKNAPCWIIDPVDGTTNFLHGIPHFAISIAACSRNIQAKPCQPMADRRRTAVSASPQHPIILLFCRLPGLGRLTNQTYLCTLRPMTGDEVKAAATNCVN